MRAVVISTHIDQTTGYSKVTYNLLKQMSTLAPKIKTYHFGFQRHPTRANTRKYPAGVLSYDAAANEDPKEDGFGYNKIHDYIETVHPDIVLIYNDPYTIAKFIEAMKHSRETSTYKLWLYVDQVYTGIAQPLIDILHKHADRVYCFSEMWKKTFLEYGSFPDVRILSHAVDPSVFSCMTLDARKTIRTNIGISEDAIVILNANRNSQRKRLDLTICGFTELVFRNPTKPYHLLIATNIQSQTGAHHDLQRIFISQLKKHGLDAQIHGLKFSLIDTSPPNVWSDEAINELYNLADIGINTSDGEGFGLCQLEHMYTGAPQVVTDVGTYRSFLDPSVGEFILPNGDFFFPGGMPHGFSCPTFARHDVATALEKMIQTLDEKKLAIRSYTFPSWTRVCDSFLEDIICQSVSIVSVPAIPSSLA